MPPRRDLYDWVELSKGRYALIKKRIGSGWLKVGEVRNEHWCKELVRLLNVGVKG